MIRATEPRTCRAASQLLQPSGSSRGTAAALGVIVGIAFALRLAYAIPKHVCFGDEACYIWLAQSLFGGQGYTYYAGTPELHFPPLFPLVLGLLNFIVRDWEAVTRAAYVACGALLPLPVYFLGKLMYSRRAGLISAMLTALMPAFAVGVLFGETMSEPLYLLCMFSGLALTYKAAISKSLGFASAAGASLGLANLTRSEGQVYLLAGLAFLVGLSLFPRPRDFGRRALQVALYLAMFLAVAAPYMLYLHSHTGQWSLDTKSMTSYTTTRALVNQDGVGFQRDTWGLDDSGEVHYFAHGFDQGLLQLLTGKYKDRVLTDIQKNLSTVWALLVRPWICGRYLMALALIGFIASLVIWRRPGAEFLNFLVMGTLAAVLVFFVTERFLYGILLPVLLWSGCALDAFALGMEKYCSRRSQVLQRFARIALMAFFAVVCAYQTHQGYRRFLRKQPEQNEVWAAADWLRKNTPSDAVVMTTNTEVAFHAGRRWLPLPVAERSRVVEYGRRCGATYLCLRGRYLDRRPEQGAELFDGARDFDTLELLVKSGLEPGDPRFVAYRLKNAAPPR